MSTEPNVNQCQLCLHKLSIHSDLGLFGHVLPGHIHAGILNVNYGHCLVIAWSFLGHANDQRNVLKRGGFPGFGHFGHFFSTL